MNSTAKNSPRYQQQYQKAVKAAASVFAIKGYHGSSTGDIASELGIRQGSLYYYFKSKESALEEVCLSALYDYVNKMEQVIEQPMPFKEKLTAAIACHLSSYRENNEALKVHNEQRLHLSEEKRAKIKQLGSQYRQQLEDILLAGVNDGSFAVDLDCNFTAISLIGLCNHWGAMLIRDPTLNLQQITHQCATLALNGCTGSNPTILSTDENHKQ